MTKSVLFAALISITTLCVFSDEETKCIPYYQSDAFTLAVLPRKAQNANVGQKCIFLVKTLFTDTTNTSSGDPVNLSVTPVGLNRDFDVSLPRSVSAGNIAEVVITPRSFCSEQHPGEMNLMPVNNGVSEENTICVKLIAERNNVKRTEILRVNVISGEINNTEQACKYLDQAMNNLAFYHPQLGITSGHYQLEGTSVCSDLIIVSYAVFLSPEWEIGIRWHNMIFPDDWLEIYFRNRSTELNGSMAFRMDSLTKNTPMKPMPLPSDGIWR